MNVQTVGFLALAATAFAPAVAIAQSADRAGERFDSRISRRPVAAAPVVTATATTLSLEEAVAASPRLRNMLGQAPTQEGAEITVSFQLAAPFTFNSNPEGVSSGRDGDGHTDPGFELAITRETARGILSVSAAGDMDLYFDRPANDSTTLVGSVNYDFKTALLGGAVPFLNYTVADAYAGQFDDHAVTIHDFALGANLRRELPKVAFSISGSLTRRETSSAAANQNRLRGQVGLSGKWAMLGWSLGQGVLYKDYTGGPNKGREDVAFITKAAISAPLSAGFALSFGAQLEHNDSSRPGQDYTVWDIGPTLSRSF